MKATQSGDAGSDSSRDRLQLEFWRLDRLVPSTRNARTHNAAQVATPSKAEPSLFEVLD
jgi:hypothetical protein